MLERQASIEPAPVVLELTRLVINGAPFLPDSIVRVRALELDEGAAAGGSEKNRRKRTGVNFPRINRAALPTDQFNRHDDPTRPDGKA
jgi:hypothetical protein